MYRALPKYTLWPYVLFWALLCGAILYLAAYKFHQNKEYATAAVAVSGEITRKFSTVYHSARHGDSYHYYLAYTYQAGRNLFTNDRTEVAHESWDEVERLDRIPVRYLVRDNAESRLDIPSEQEKARMAAGGPLAIGLIIFFAGGFYLAYLWGENHRRQRLVKEGQRCTGTVKTVETQTIGTGRGRRTVRFITIDFTDGKGNQLSGRSWDISWFKQRHWKVGNPITIYCDRNSSRVFTADLDHKPDSV